MRLEFHPAVQRDFNQALDYYDAEGGRHLADRFEIEFKCCLSAIKAGPTRFSFDRKVIGFGGRASGVFRSSSFTA